MWLRNYYNILTAQRGYLNKNNGSVFSSTAPTAYDAPITARSCIGTNYYYYELPGARMTYTANLNQIDAILGLDLSDPTTGPSSHAQTLGVGIGSGNTPVTFDDYKLESPLDSWHLTATDSITRTDAVYDAAARAYTSKIKIRLQASTSMTVKEIGLSLDGGCNTAFLIYREVLAQPVQLSANDVLCIEITCKQPVLSPHDYT